MRRTLGIVALALLFGITLAPGPADADPISVGTFLGGVARNTRQGAVDWYGLEGGSGRLATGERTRLFTDSEQAALSGLTPFVPHVALAEPDSHISPFVQRSLWIQHGSDSLVGDIDPESTSLTPGASLVMAPPAAVPEPASLLLLGTGLVGIGRVWRRRRG